VQTLDEAFVLSVVPAGIIPTAPPPDVDGLLVVGFVVTVLPLAVVTGAGGVFAGVVGAGAVFLGSFRGVVRGAVRRSGVVRFVAVGAGAAGVDAGTSLSCGCAAESRPASAKSRFSVLSVPSAVLSGPFFASERHAANAVNAANTIGAPTRRIYFGMSVPPGVS
jgi:hypothetical protein